MLLIIALCDQRSPTIITIDEQEEELKDAILLVFANKQDSKGAMNAQQVGIYYMYPRQ